MRSFALAISLLLAGMPVVAQNTELALEDLREQARQKIQEMKVEFERDLSDAVRDLSSIPSDTESTRGRIARKKISPWASAFPERILEVMTERPNANLRSHLTQVLIQTGDKRIAPLALSLLGRDSDLDFALVNLISRVGTSEHAPKLVELLARGDELHAKLRGAVLIAVARLKASNAAALARRHFDHPAPDVRASAIQALALAQASPRDDAAEIIRLAEKDPSPAVRLDALRALAAYPGDFDVLRLLHDTVEKADATMCSAALSALEAVATKELSVRYLIQVVERRSDMVLRERATRMLTQKFGDSRGAKILARPSQEIAERNPKNGEHWIQLGDLYRRYGAYLEALEAYKRVDSQSPYKQDARNGLGRAYAALGRFEEARRQLKDYTTLEVFAEEPEFQEMKRLPKYRSLFGKE